MTQVVKRLVVAGAALVAACVAFDSSRANDSLPPLPTARIDDAELEQTISHGSRVDIQGSLREGRWTVVAFGADWCGSCRALEPSLESLIRKHRTVALRHVDIASWDSPVAIQYRIRSIPQLRLYDGTRLVTSDGDQVMRILRQ